MKFDVNKVTTVKSGLAKLLAMENISIRHVMGTKTASFDVKNRILRLPVWKDISEDLYDMLVVHEVGHALETPHDLWIKEIAKLGQKHNPKPGDSKALERTMKSIQGYANILEDIRIDIRQRNRYPGSRRNYVIGYKELFERDFFQTSKNPIHHMTFINRLNIYSKSGFSGVTVVPFTAEEKFLVKRSQETDSFMDVIALAEEFWLLQIRHPDGMPSDEENNGEGAGETEGEAGEESEGEAGEESEGEGQDDTPLIPPEARDLTTVKDLEDSKKEENKKEEEKSENNSREGGATGSDSPPVDLNNLPESETDEAFRENVDTLAVDDGISYYYSQIPGLIGEPWHDYKVFLAEHRAWHKTQPKLDLVPHINALNEFKVDENKAISFMVKEFEMRKSADAYSKSMIAKTGVINTNKLHSYQFNDDIFKRNTVVPTGKNHGFVMFIDWSSSMQSNIINTVKQLFSLVLFCRRISVPFEVYTFTTKTGSEYAFQQAGARFEKNPESLQMDLNSNIRNILSSRMNATDLNDAMIIIMAMANTLMRGRYNQVASDYPPGDLDAMHGTPLNETLLIAERIIRKFQKQTGVQVTNVIMLTDGAGCAPALGTNDYNIKTRKYCILVQDPKTREEYALPVVTKGYGYSNGVDNHVNSAYDWTNMFLRVLKQRTGCNLVGFYLLNYNSSYMWKNVVFQGKSAAAPDSEVREAKKSWKENGFVSIKNSGYDEYFLISSAAMKLNQKDFEIEKLKNPDAKMTSAKISKMFTEFMEKKTTNRIMLSNFIKKITIQN